MGKAANCCQKDNKVVSLNGSSLLIESPRTLHWNDEVRMFVDNRIIFEEPLLEMSKSECSPGKKSASRNSSPVLDSTTRKSGANSMKSFNSNNSIVRARTAFLELKQQRKFQHGLGRIEIIQKEKFNVVSGGYGQLDPSTGKLIINPEANQSGSFGVAGPNASFVSFSKDQAGEKSPAKQQALENGMSISKAILVHSGVSVSLQGRLPNVHVWNMEEKEVALQKKMDFMNVNAIDPGADF